MAEITREQFRRTVLRAEIMALLHDVGKLGWPFVGKGCGQLKHKPSLTAIHTSEFLDNNDNRSDALQDLQNRLQEPLGDWLADIPGTPLKALGSLLAAHHSGKDISLGEGGQKDVNAPLSHLIPLIIYADTADSLYSKGAESVDHCKQGTDIFLTTPFGNVQSSVSQKSLDADAAALHKALAKLLDGWQQWDDDTLIHKRDELQTLLRCYGGRHLAETRLPNNDVNLWQHSASVAGIFKALLAGCLLSDNWDGLLRDNELAHSNQRLAFLAFRWDTDAYMARSLRSFEVVGRQAKLQKLADRLKTLLETDFCLGNELYRDRQGICFLTPDLEAAQGGPAAELPAELHVCMDQACNGKIVSGELPWKIHMRACGLQLGDFLSFWDNPGAPLYSGPVEPIWREEWALPQGRRQPQVCPRCGLHAVWEDKGRTGSSDDIACETCRELAALGHNTLKTQGAKLPEKKKDTFLSFLRADDEEEGGDGATSRVALIQGVFSLAALHGAGEPGWSHLLTPGKDGSLQDVASVTEKWRRLQNLGDMGEDNALREDFASILGMPRKSFCTEKEGWCGDEALSLGLKARVTDAVRRLVFRGEALPDDEGQIAAAMLLWGARQHPAPSRLARVWEELGAFTDWASGRGGTDENPLDSPCLPLTRDIGSFQILVPAREAWRLLRDIRAAYERRFGRVRHILPLHVSAGIFRRKAPLYIAMDAARRFRKLAENCAPQFWELCGRQCEGNFTRLQWRTPDGRPVAWDVPCCLPNTDEKGKPREDWFRTWYFAEGENVPTHLSHLKKGTRYLVWPSTFDFEVLDASVRRYDIHYSNGRRAHYMLRAEQGPRPYPLEIITDWDRYLHEDSGLFKKNDDGRRQRKNAVELLGRLHLEWGWGDPRDADSAAGIMTRHILGVTMPEHAVELRSAAADGSFFDVCEWADFITK